MATIAITEEKKKHVVRLIKSFKAIDSAMVKKAYNAVKNQLDLDDLSSMMEIAKKEI